MVLEVLYACQTWEACQRYDDVWAYRNHGKLKILQGEVFYYQSFFVQWALKVRYCFLRRQLEKSREKFGEASVRNMDNIMYQVFWHFCFHIISNDLLKFNHVVLLLFFLCNFVCHLMVQKGFFRLHSGCSSSATGVDDFITRLCNRDDFAFLGISFSMYEGWFQAIYSSTMFIRFTCLWPFSNVCTNKWC